MAKNDYAKTGDDMLTADDIVKETKVEKTKVAEPKVPKAPLEDPKKDAEEKAVEKPKASKPVSKSDPIDGLTEAITFLAFKTLEPSEFKEFQQRLPK